MSTSSLTAAPKELGPYIVKLAPANHNWLGRFVQWVRSANKSGPFQRAAIYTFVFYGAILLMLTIVGIPLVFLAFKEHIRQEERSRYEREIHSICKQAEENTAIVFKQARMSPFKDVNITLHPLMRQQLLLDCRIPQEEGKSLTDKELFLASSLKLGNVLARYQPTISY